MTDDELPTPQPPRAARCLGRRTVRLVAALLLMLAGSLGVAVAADDGAKAPRKAIVLKVEGAIGPATSDYIVHGIARAATEGAALVVLSMDTPGGLDTSMREIIRAIMASKVPVAAYVTPSGARAASAGTYILYASHIAAMSPGTNLGAATPVQLQGGSPFGAPPDDEKDDDSKDGKDKDGRKNDKAEDKRASAPRDAHEAKAINDAVAYIRSLAALRGRNADWAEKSVREAASLAADEALKHNVIDIVASGLDDLFRQAHGRKVKVGPTQAEMTLDTRDLVPERVEPNWRIRLLAAITNPNVALILMMIGIYGLIFEFMNPGSLYPGTIGAICLLVALYALAALPVNYAGAGLIVLGLILMVAEAFTPSFGALGIGGTIAFVVGAAILIDTEVPGFAPSWPVIGGVAATSLAFTLLVARMFMSSRKRRVVTGVESMIGAVAQVTDWQGTRGHVFVHGERWNAVAGAPLARGRSVRVVAVEGLTLTVAPDETTTP